jgi:hypothetical protein
MEGGPLGQAGEQVSELKSSGPQEPCIRGHSHYRLSDLQRDDLRIRDSSSGVFSPLGQEIVHRAVNGDEQQIEVGVHRGPPKSRQSVFSTAGLDLPAYNPSPNPKTTAQAVALLI